MAGIDIRDLLDIEMQEPSSSFIKTRKQEMYSHNVSIDEEISEPRKYRELINLLHMASDYDEFNFLFNSPGGGLSAAMAIIEGMKNSDATIRGIITGECHSAASLMLLNCHEIIVSDAAHMMVHTANYSTGGITSNVQKHVDFSTKMIEKILTETYEGFLTPAELTNVMMGVEYWFDNEEIGKRLKARGEFQQAKQAASIPKPRKRKVATPTAS